MPVQLETTGEIAFVTESTKGVGKAIAETSYISGANHVIDGGYSSHRFR